MRTQKTFTWPTDTPPQPPSASDSIPHSPPADDIEDFLAAVSAGSSSKMEDLIAPARQRNELMEILGSMKRMRDQCEVLTLETTLVSERWRRPFLEILGEVRELLPYLVTPFVVSISGIADVHRGFPHSLFVMLAAEAARTPTLIDSVWSDFFAWANNHRTALREIYARFQGQSIPESAELPLSRIPCAMLIQNPQLVAKTLQLFGPAGCTVLSLPGVTEEWIDAHGNTIAHSICSCTSSVNSFTLHRAITIERLSSVEYQHRLQRLTESFGTNSNVVLEWDPELNDVDRYVQLNRRYHGHAWGIIAAHGAHALEAASEYFPLYDRIAKYVISVHQANRIGEIFRSISPDVLRENASLSPVDVVEMIYAPEAASPRLLKLGEPSLQRIARKNGELTELLLTSVDSPLDGTMYRQDWRLMEDFSDVYEHLLRVTPAAFAKEALRSIPPQVLKKTPDLIRTQISLWGEHLWGICAGYREREDRKLSFSDFLQQHEQSVQQIAQYARWDTAQLLSQLPPALWSTIGVRYAQRYEDGASGMQEFWASIDQNEIAAEELQEFKDLERYAVETRGLRHIYRYCTNNGDGLDLSLLRELKNCEDANYKRGCPRTVMAIARYDPPKTLRNDSFHYFHPLQDTNRFEVIEDETGSGIAKRLTRMMHTSGVINTVILSSHARREYQRYGAPTGGTEPGAVGQLSILHTIELDFRPAMSKRNAVIVSTGCSAGQGRPHHPSILRSLKRWNSTATVIGARVPIGGEHPIVQDGRIVGLVGAALRPEDVVILR